MLDPVRRLLMRGWYRSLEAALAAVPHPEDAPVARVQGPDPVRVLLLGNGAASGWGVRTHELAMTGQLARILAGTVRRGVQVDARVDRTLRAVGLSGLLEDVPGTRYDAAVLMLGLNDAVNLTRPADWRAGVGRLLARTAELVPAEATLLLAPHPVQMVGTYRGRPGAIAERHRGILNQAAAGLAASSGVAFGVLPAPSRGTWESGHPTPNGYAEWAAWTAPRLAPLLPGCGRADDGPQPEAERQRAAEALLPDAPPDPRLDRITRLAREMFGTGMAAVSLLDGAVQKNRSVVGSDRRVLPRRWSMCDQAIRTDGALVIADLSQDPRFRDSPAVQGEEHLRFYAGYPIESPDGYRVGALCVLDDRPRDPAEIDVDALAELALLAQKELWESAGR